VGRVTLETRVDGGTAIVLDDGYAVGLGKLSPAVAASVQQLRTGLPLDSIRDKDIERLIRQLARRGLFEYRLGESRGEAMVVIEPQMSDYWPRTPALGDGDTLVLSRFAYLRRRGDEMVLESPRASALFRICDPKIATALAMLSQPQSVKQLRRQDGLAMLELLALLVDCEIVLKVDSDMRSSEDVDDLVLWDFHDLLFHARSTEGRHANPLGGEYPYIGVIAPPPGVRPSWPGQKIDLGQFAAGPSEPVPGAAAARLLSERHSTRAFDEQRPITLAELARLLDGAARVRAQWASRLDEGVADSPLLEYAARPYPSGGGSWELELYLVVDKCEGLPRGFYHYDAAAHALVPIEVRPGALDAQLSAAQLAMGASAVPQILITIAARFGRIAWKYRSLAYALILKDVGVLMQTLYLMATDLGLGGCAIGSTNIEQFARLTGIAFHVEGAVGQFALGRGTETGLSG
jgi:SagB-type dehydrogenase family enzyme